MACQLLGRKAQQRSQRDDGQEVDDEDGGRVEMQGANDDARWNAHKEPVDIIAAYDIEESCPEAAIPGMVCIGGLPLGVDERSRLVMAVHPRSTICAVGGMISRHDVVYPGSPRVPSDLRQAPLNLNCTARISFFVFRFVCWLRHEAVENCDDGCLQRLFATKARARWNDVGQKDRKRERMKESERTGSLSVAGGKWSFSS